MKSKKIISILAVLALMIGIFSACKEDKTNVVVTDVDQFAMPEEGEEIAVLHTNMGDIYLRFFEDEAPKAVENFKGLIEKEYYNSVIFHRVINNFMIQGGDPTGTGMGGESFWGSAFEDEVNKGLHYYRGTLAMANSGANTNGSQFFIIQASNDDGSLTEASLNQTFEQLAAYKGINVLKSDETIKNYVKYGGTPWLEGQHTVFGQVIEGMSVVDDIAVTEVDANDKPVKEVVIESAEIIKYNAKDFEK